MNLGVPVRVTSNLERRIFAHTHTKCKCTTGLDMVVKRDPGFLNTTLHGSNYGGAIYTATNYHTHKTRGNQVGLHTADSTSIKSCEDEYLFDVVDPG